MTGETALRAVQILMLIVAVLAVLAFLRNDLYRDPVVLWTDAAQKAPNRERPHYNLGTHLKDTGRLDQARQEWERTVELNPRHSRALNQLGSYWFLKQEYAKAERYYLAAVQADGENIEACYNLAMTFETLGNTSKALYYYQQFTAKAPPDLHDLALSVSRKMEVLQKSRRQ